MNSIMSLFKTLKKPSKLIALILYLVYIVTYIITTLASFPSNFLGVLGTLLRMCINIVFFGVVPFLIIRGKMDLAKKLWPLIAFYWLVPYFTDAVDFTYISTTNKWGGNVCDILTTIIGGFVVASVVLFIIDCLKGSNKYTGLIYIFFGIALCFCFTYTVIDIVRYAGESWFKWDDYLSYIRVDLVKPAGMFFMTLFLSDKISAEGDRVPATENNAPAGQAEVSGAEESNQPSEQA